VRVIASIYNTLSYSRISYHCDWAKKTRKILWLCAPPTSCHRYFIFVGYSKVLWNIHNIGSSYRTHPTYLIRYTVGRFNLARLPECGRVFPKGFQTAASHTHTHTLAFIYITSSLIFYKRYKSSIISLRKPGHKTCGI